MKTGFGVQRSSISNTWVMFHWCSGWKHRETQQRDGATYQRSLLGEKQQHFNTRQNNHSAV